MADARALFKRHYEQFVTIAGDSDWATKAILYAACIIAETIRTDVYDEPFRVISPLDVPKVT